MLKFTNSYFLPISLSFMDSAWQGTDGVLSTVVSVIENVILPASIFILAVYLLVLISKAAIDWKEGNRIILRPIVVVIICIIALSFITFSDLVSKVTGTYQASSPKTTASQNQRPEIQ